MRHYLYLAALRLILSSSTARGWYERRSAHAAGHEMKAVVALMRKLVRALFHVARGAPFQVEKLFDLRRLDNTSRAA